MACSNPAVKGLCGPAKDTFKKICKRCKWRVSAEEAAAARKTAKYNQRMSQRGKGCAS